MVKKSLLKKFSADVRTPQELTRLISNPLVSLESNSNLKPYSRDITTLTLFFCDKFKREKNLYNEIEFTFKEYINFIGENRDKKELTRKIDFDILTHDGVFENNDLNYFEYMLYLLRTNGFHYIDNNVDVVTFVLNGKITKIHPKNPNQPVKYIASISDEFSQKYIEKYVNIDVKGYLEAQKYNCHIMYLGIEQLKSDITKIDKPFIIDIKEVLKNINIDSSIDPKYYRREINKKLEQINGKEIKNIELANQEFALNNNLSFCYILLKYGRSYTRVQLIPKSKYFNVSPTGIANLQIMIDSDDSADKKIYDKMDALHSFEASYTKKIRQHYQNALIDKGKDDADNFKKYLLNLNLDNEVKFQYFEATYIELFKPKNECVNLREWLKDYHNEYLNKENMDILFDDLRQGQITAKKAMLGWIK